MYCVLGTLEKRYDGSNREDGEKSATAQEMD